MANSKQAKKRATQNEKRRQHNMSNRSEMRTYIKNVRKAVEAKNLEEANKQLQLAVSKLDKLANKGTIHKNTASRSKSRLSQLIKKNSASAA